MLNTLRKSRENRGKLMVLVLTFALISGIISLFNMANVSASQKTDVKIADIAVGSYQSMAIDEGGGLWTWGENYNGKLGNGVTGGIYNIPKLITKGYANETLPPIKKINGSYQNTLLLDINGGVWTVGTGELYANGDNTLAVSNLFKRVNLGGAAAVDISSRHLGGAAVTADGHIWVWGRNHDYSAGLGNANYVSQPKMITTGTKNTGSPYDAGGDKSNDIDISNVKFINIATSDYNETTGSASIALTDNGEIWTWGVSYIVDEQTMKLAGGSYKPKKVTGVHASSTVQQLPAVIKKIDANVGGFGFLDGNGNFWTWGIPWSLLPGGNKLGQGVSATNIQSNCISAPKKVDFVKTAAGQQAIPKIQDFAMFAWASHIVDVNGGTYGVGELIYNTNTNNIPSYSSLYTAFPIEGAGKIIKTSSGHLGTVLFLDEDGNVWSNGTYSGTASQSTQKSRLVEFPKTKILFDDINSSPDNQTKIYKKNKNTKAVLSLTLTAPDSVRLDEVRYIKVYDDDPDFRAVYSETTGKAYFTNDRFNSKYNNTDPLNEGIMRQTGLQADLDVYDNCIVWMKANGTNKQTQEKTANLAVYTYENFYTPARLYHNGIVAQGEVNEGMTLYSQELFVPDTDVGLYYNSSGAVVENPYLGADQVTVQPKALDYWQLFPEGQIRKIILNQSVQADLLTTFTYQKNLDMWWNSMLHYVTYESRQELRASDTIELMAPIGAETYAKGLDKYYPPVMSDESYKPVGYRLSNVGIPNTNDYVAAAFPDGFDPVIAKNNEDIYIIYRSNTIEVKEHYILESDRSPISSVTYDYITDGDTYNKTAPKISGYAAVSYEVIPFGESAYQGGLLGSVTVGIAAIEKSHDIYFIYKTDANNNGISDDDEGVLLVSGIGLTIEGAEKELFSTKPFYGNAALGETIDLNKNMLKLWIENLDEWLFAEDLNVAVSFHYPFQAKVTAEKFYYYYADLNKNGIPDKDEGVVHELYVDVLGTTLKVAAKLNMVPGETYQKTAPFVSNYVIFDVEVDGISIQSTEAFISEVGIGPHLVKFIYKQDSNNNGIPDDEEGSVIFKWVGVKADDTEETLFTYELFGIKNTIGTIKHNDNSFYKASDTWVFDASKTLQYDLTDGLEYTLNAIPNEIVFYYDEDANRNGIPDWNEEVIVTVKGIDKETLKELYAHEICKKVSDIPFEVYVQTVLNYNLASESNFAMVVPRNAMDYRVSVEFYYKANQAEVEILAYYKDTTKPIETHFRR